MSFDKAEYEVVTFDPSVGFPVGKNLFYWCSICGEKVPSLSLNSAGCKCGNVFIDTDAARVAIKETEKVKLVRRKRKSWL